MNVLVAASPHDLSEAPADAFAMRHLAMVRLLAEHHDVTILGLRPALDDAEFAPDLRELVCREVRLPVRSTTRARRLGRAVRRVAHDPLTEWERAIEETARATAPDVAVTIGPWLDYEYRVLFHAYPSIYVFEEDITRMPEIAAQSRQAALLRSFEDLGRRQAGMVPTAVVVISETEAPAARRRFPRSRVVHLPYTLDASEWPLAESESIGEHVLVVGNLAQDRNAEGLVDILQEIKARNLTEELPVRLVSETGLTPTLATIAEEPWILDPGPVDDLWNVYRQNAAALVPSTRATGFKTTVLQAWTAGCPVVCRPASARTLGSGTTSAVLVGDTAGEVVDHLLALRRDAPKRHQLVAAGLELARTSFSPSDGQQHLLTLTAEVGSAPRHSP